MREVLALIVINGRTLAEIADVWLESARQMGELLKERNKLTGVEKDATAVTASHLRELRNAWIRSVRALEFNAELVNLDDAARHDIFGILREAQSQAARSRPPKPDAHDFNGTDPALTPTADTDEPTVDEPMVEEPVVEEPTF